MMSLINTFQFFILLASLFGNGILINGNKLPDFVCVDGTEMALEKVCNGAVDCPDGSDEVKELCYHIICPHGMFRCHYGACVHQVTRCNGKFECADKSDESQCGRKVGSCEKNEYKCQSGECIDISKMCDDKEDCTDGSDESKTTCEEYPCPENTFHCKHGGCVHLDARCNGYQDCVDGSDESEPLCKSLKCGNDQCALMSNKITCPPITSTRIRVTCESKAGKKKGIVPCDHPVPAGTIAKYECKQFYIPTNEKHAKNTRATCQLDGTWSREILICEPECGKAEPNIIPLIVKGWSTKPGRYPWHAALYVLEEGKWTFWCGGSLISEKAVLTAAHCTWKINPENIKVGLGKYFTDFEKKQDFTQIIDVEKVVIQPLYQDQPGNYGSDLAILVLKTTAELSNTVNPICIDWDKHDIETHLLENSTGLIVGMGVNENDTFSETIRGTRIPVVSDKLCIKDQKNDFRKYITYTVFCAGWRNDTGVCNGDSGGGLVFPKLNNKNKQVIQGVVSISPRKLGTSYCDPKYFAIFTKVGSYLDWIKKVLDSIHNDKLKNNIVTLESVYYR